MKKISIALAFTGFLLVGCSNNSTEPVKEQTETVAKEEHHHEGAEPIELNNGQKWKVDDSMMIYIGRMENDIASFTKAGQKEYSSLATTLQPSIDSLTSSCTMQGKAHDELHKWLLPYIDMVKEMKNTKTEAEGSKQLQNIRHSLDTFHQYFL